MNEHNNDFEWDSRRNDYGSALYDMSHELLQQERERKARQFVWSAAAVILALGLTVVCWIWP